MSRSIAVAVLAVAACGNSHGGQPGGGGGGGGEVDAPGGPGIDAPSAGGDAAGDSTSGATDARADVVTGGPCESGNPGATLLRIGFKDVQYQAEVVYLADGTPNNAGLAGVYGYDFGFVAPYAGTDTDGGLRLDYTDFIDVGTSTAAITSLTSVTLSIDGQAGGGGTGVLWQSNLGSGQTGQYAIAPTISNAWFSVDVTAAFAARDANSGLRIKTLASDNAFVAHRIELCVVAE